MAEPAVFRDTLTRNLVVFGRALRAAGIAVDPGQIGDFHAALDLIDGTDRSELYRAARAIFVRRVEDLDLFDRVFRQYCKAVAQLSSEVDSASPAPSQLAAAGQNEARVEAQPPGGKPSREQLVLERALSHELAAADAETATPEGAPIPIRTYSAREALHEKDFGTLTQAELEAARELLQRMSWQIGSRPSRRMRVARRGDTPDLRTMLRRSLRTSGDLAGLAWRLPKTRPHPVVVLGDVSGSMDRYTRLLIQFFYALKRGRGDVEVFVFGTRLTRITHELDHHRIDDAMRQVAGRVLDWSGGTRIGEALGAFNRLWARRILGRSVITVIVSDGWDRGSARELAREIELLQRRSYRLVWLNPLLGLAEYEPLTTGMQTALPYVDDFLPANSLASLAELATRLAELEARRPVRRQRGARSAVRGER